MIGSRLAVWACWWCWASIRWEPPTLTSSAVSALLLVSPRPNPDRNLPAALPPWPTDHGEGGRSQQLRPRPLHHRHWDHRASPGPHPQTGELRPGSAPAPADPPPSEQSSPATLQSDKLCWKNMFPQFAFSSILLLLWTKLIYLKTLITIMIKKIKCQCHIEENYSSGVVQKDGWLY